MHTYIATYKLHIHTYIVLRKNISTKFMNLHEQFMKVCKQFMKVHELFANC